MEHMSPEEQNGINGIVRSVLKLFVRVCFVDVLTTQECSGFEAMLVAVTLKLQEMGNTLSDDLVRELLQEVILEVGAEVGIQARGEEE